jgi:Tfp pilus assembly protein PilV
MRSRESLQRRSARARIARVRLAGQLGLTVVEVVVAMSVMVVAASIFCQMLAGTTRLRQLNRENALAADSARVVLEQMRNAPIREVYRRYNEDPKDDPLGQGTGPGQYFDVAGLTALADAPLGRAGQILFPSQAVQVTSSGGGKKAAGSTATTSIQWHLREDFVDDALGMPRDLNGDNVIDSLNHATDYIILPVRIRVSWQSPTGPRHFDLLTQLGDFRTDP